MFGKKKAERTLREKLDSVLNKYWTLENPYFVNYIYIANQGGINEEDTEEYDRLTLFREMLVRRKSFEELAEFPQLTLKLVRSTGFRFLFNDFASQTKHHVCPNLEGTLRSWIDERGPIFRSHLPLILYYFWNNKVHTGEISFQKAPLALVSNDELTRLSKLCEALYFDLLVSRLQTTLEGFDPSAFVTIYAVDVMSGQEFEEFLAKLYRAIGFDVELTKKGADQGADLFVQKFGLKTVIQAKNYSDNVGNAAVQQVLAAKAFYACDRAMVLTNSYFTASAKALAESSGVELVDRRDLSRYLDQYNRAMLEAEETTH